VTDTCTLRSNLPELSSAEVSGVYGDSGSALRAAVTFKWTDSEVIFEGLRNSVWKLFRARHHVLQAPEILCRTTAHVGLQERGSGEQECDFVLADQSPDGACIQGARMVHHAHANADRKTQSSGKAKRVEKRKNAEDLVSPPQHEDLV